MARDWKEMGARLRENQQKNLRNYERQNEKSERRRKVLSELQSSQDAVLRAGRGRR